MTSKLMAPLHGVSYAVLALALAGGCAFAQVPAQADASALSQTATPEVELAPVTVSAHNGFAVPCNQTGVSVSVLDIPALRKEGVYTLSEAITSVPGVYAMPGGGVNQRGNYDQIAIRGMSSDSCLLPMIDGMRIYNNGNVALPASNVIARTSLFNVGTAEVLKGSHGALYGGGAMGGVLFLETPEGQEEAPRFQLFNEAGSFGSYTGNVTAQGREKKLSYYVSATYEHTNNDIHFADRSGATVKHHGRYQTWQEAVRLDYQANESNKITTTFRREDSSYHKDDDLFNWRTNLVTAKWQSQLTDRWSSSLLAGYYGHDYDDANSMNDYYADVRNVQVEWRNAYRWNEKNTTVAGFAWNRSATSVRQSADVSGRNTDGGLENVYALFAEHQFAPVRNWDNSLAVRLDQSNIYDALFTFRAASRYRFNEDRTSAFASVGRGYRTPTSLQRSNSSFLYSWAGMYDYKYNGNPNLNYESSLSVDVGMEHEFAKNHFVSATLFWEERHHGIYQSYDWFAYPTEVNYYNSDKNWIARGVELSLHGNLGDGWDSGYTLSCTLMEPRGNDGKSIPVTARQTWYADLHTSPLKGLTTGVALVAASNRTNYDSKHLDSYYSLRWFAQYEVNEHLSFHVRVENLTDQKFVTEDNGSPGASYINPGIGIFGGCTVSF